MGKITSKLARLALAAATFGEGNKATAQTESITPEQAMELVAAAQVSHVANIIENSDPQKQQQANMKRMDAAIKPLIRNKFQDPEETLQNACVTNGIVLSRHKGKPTVFEIKPTPDSKGKLLEITLHRPGKPTLYEHRVEKPKSHVCQEIVREANKGPNTLAK